jgi:tRNA threonylcarbamoyladenosine biosynthesis protein TsaE
MQITITSLEEIGSAARSFISTIDEAKVIAFYGSMGAGKTTFIRALCETLGVREPVTSPTFAIVNEYQATSPDCTGVRTSTIYHFDFYRIRRLTEAYDIGFEDYLDSGALCLIEWPELIEELLPDDALHVHIDVDDTGIRTINW